MQVESLFPFSLRFACLIGVFMPARNCITERLANPIAVFAGIISQYDTFGTDAKLFPILIENQGKIL